jgi:hypothetical protein
MLVETHTTPIVDSETDTAAPAEPSGGARDLLYLDDMLDAAEAPKLLGHEVCLELALSRDSDVLPVAATTSSGA